MNFNDPLSILLVEDNELNQRLMKISLTRFNYQVTVAENGLIGLELFKSNNFDLVLMDIMMPVMDGFESTKGMRQHEATRSGYKRTPIIAFTANTINNDREKCIAGGMDDILEKPFDIQRFKEIIESLS